MNTLKIENLYKSFDKKHYILSNINVEVTKNQSFCIIGPSGSGKSTLGKCILRFIKPDFGNIYFKGEDIYTIKDYPRHVSFIPQDPMSSINPRFGVLDAILEPLRIMSLAFDMKNIINDILALGLKEELFNKKIRDLSGGERQRVAIARAFITNPELIIADEPTSSLDAIHKSIAASLFLKIKESKTLFLITHDIKFAQKICDKIGVMYNGKIVEIRDKEDIFKSPKHEFTKTLLNSYSLDCKQYSYE
ncbi:ABC transporter related [Hydrogenobaculum sp. Y04AAS1]|uniref:ATP-binding cassette domain-containing protein n=1 Tax=Hydrogenobaculum sp. (strain Y04AAS1) TaxID=380749 RepID=UPI00015BCE76|nr:ABC transporter related [Hydrogenobaculum sp. Y04AAS1]HCT67280.1 ABC transporter ATP-binding protein [Hydrogenobaculum sp.]